MTSRKQLAINQRALYDDAVKNKMFWNATPSFQEFQHRLQNPKYVQTVQANYRAHGRSGDAFDTLSGFRDYFCVSDEDKQDMTQGVGNMIADTKARLAGQQRYNKLKQHQDKQRGRYGRLDLGVKNPLTNDNVVREPLTGRYLTSDGAKYAQEHEAARAQNQLDEINDNYTEAVKRGDLPSAFEVQDEDGNYALMEDLGVKPGVHVTEKGKQQQLAGLVNTRKSVEEQYNALYRKLEEDFKRSAPFSLNTHSQYGIDDNDMRLQAYLNSNAQYRRLKAQLHQLDNAIKVGDEAVKGRAEDRYVKNAKGMLGYAYRDLKTFGASALRGLWNAVSDVSTWDLGLQDLQDNMTLYTTVKKARQKGYKNLNDEERQMLDVAAKTGAYTAENQQYLGRGYKAGNVTGESLPFMVEMALNPASGLGEAAMSKYMRNAIAKYGKEAVRKEAWKYVTKKCGYRIAGDVLGAALMTGTTGSARTLADTYDRLTGDIKSTYDSKGNIVYDGTENEEKGILKAYLKAFGATAIENHSEFVGEYFNPLLKGVGTLTMKGWKKVNAKSANAFLDNLKDMGNTSTAKWLGNLFEKTQWHGTIGEYAEEVVGNIENALLVGDSTLDAKEGTGVFNLDQNIDTFLGVSLMGGFFSTLKTGAYIRDKVKGERKILMQQSLDLDNSIRYALGADPRLADKWKEWRVALAQGTDEEKKQALKEISENTNGYIKKAMYDYSANAQKLAGMDKATQGAIEDGTITPEQAQRDADIEQAHEEGLAAEGTARHDIQQEHQLRENSLARMLGISAEQLDRMEDEDIESMTGQNDALDTAIYDYQTSRERYQGVIDRATDEVEQAGIDAAHQIDLYTDHSTGQIRPCVIKGNNGKEDYQGYIVNGNIATHPDGAIDVSGSDKMILYFDPETGKIEHGDASTFASLGESADATVARQQAIDEAKQQAAQAQSRDIDGGVGEDGNVSEAMPTFPQSSDQEERNAADFDIGQVVNAETGEVIPVSFEGLAEGENAYLTGGRPDGKAKDRLKVTIVDAEGNVTNRVMKRGNVQMDGRMSAEDFRNAYEEAVSSRMAPEADINGQENNVDEEGVVAGGAAPSADKAATSEEEGAASEPAVRDKNGNPIYDKMPISATIADLYDGALDDAEIDGFVSAQIAEAEKAVEKMEKKKPKVGTDKAKYLADKKAWEEGLQEAQRKVQYWHDVKAEVEKITTPEDARGYEEELNGDAAQAAYRNGSDAASYGVREVTAEFMQSGDVKITPESYRKETGFGAAEQRAMVGKISKGGKSIDKLAEDLEVFDRENYNGMYFGGDSSVAKDAILDYLSSPDSRKGVKKMQSEAEREYVEAYEAERDRYYQEKYHMSYEEYLVYSSQEMPELLRKYSNFDEQLFLERYADEIEAALQKREEQLKQEENGKEGNVSAGEESGHGRSNQVQSGERTDDTGRGEVGKDSAGEVGPRHEGVVESEAASKETITPEQQSLLSRRNSSQYTAERESSDHKATNNTDTKQENEEKSAKALSNKQSSGQAKMSHKEKTGEKEAMSPTPAMIDRMIEEQRVDDVSELLISSELKKAAEGIAGAFGMKVVYLKKVFIRSNDPAVEDFEGNGFVRNGVIYLSLKEANIAQFTFGHELLHQLKQIDADSYMRIRQKVIDVMGRKAFEMEVKARQMTYANVPGYTLFEDYAEEVIADTLGDIITHTDMLPNIARSLKENPSLLDRLLNVVDNVRQYFRGKIGDALGDLVNDIRNTYEMTARQGAELGLSTPLKITEHTKFSLKDNQGNPLNQDGTLKLEKIKSVDELTDEDFLHPTRNVELPSLPKKIADAIGTEGKPVVIKKNIFERNYMRHKDVTPELSKIIFKSALYNPDLYGQNQKKTRPYNWVLINTKDEKGNNRTVLLEVNPNKDNVEIVHWHFIDERGLKKIRKQVDREDGQLLILPSDKEEVGALSDPTVNLSAANIDNSSETAKESEGKDRQRYASLGVSRSLGKEAGEGEPRWASLGLSEQQLAERQEVNGGTTLFSLKKDRTLAGVHNITEEKLLKAIKQGGLANPSVAVIDSSKQNHDDYGDISLILPSDKVAKRTGKNAGTWQGDAWTPTYPQVERQMSNKGAEKASNDVSSVPSDMYSEVRRGLDRWLDGGEENSAMAYMFLHEKGVAPEPKKIQPKFSDEAYNELKSITAGNFNIYGIGKADARKVLDMYIDAKFDGDKDLYEEKTKAWLERNKSIVDAGANGGMRYDIAKENVELYDEYGFNYKGVQTFVRDVEYDHRKTGVDMNATLNEVEDYIKTNNLTDEFNTWMEGKEKEYGIKEVIFDGFTPSGNRRYVPNTLENVSKIMKKQGRNGSTGISVSFQNFAARLMPSYGTLKDIRSKKGLLTSDREKLDKFREKWSNVFFELGMKCQPDATGTFDDYGLARLSEAAMASDPQAYLKKEYNVDFSDEDTKRLKEMVKAIKEEYPAMYFETKFERPVGFDEFSSAVVPTTASNEVKQALQNAGVQIYEYDKEKEGDRSRAFNEAINSSDNIRFSLDKDKGTVASPSKPSKAEAVLRDAVIDRLRENGMEVITDVVEGQKVLDEANGRGKLQMGDAPETFAERLKQAVENRGVVMPGLNETYVEVVKDIPRHGYTGTIAEATKQAIQKAKEKYTSNGKAKVLHYDNNGVEFDYVISGNAIEICLSPKHQAKSGNKGVHLALAEHLDEVINKSVEVEEHPDYIKGKDGKRGEDINPDALMHRFYGVAVIDGVPCRVMTLMREEKSSATSNGIHSYEVQKIEVLDNDLPSTSNGVGSQNQLGIDSPYPLAKLLKGVEKSYDKGKKLLEESKKRSADLREQRVYHGSGADFEAFDHRHMGEGQGSQVFGWGTYVTSSKAIGESYAQDSAMGDSPRMEMEYTGDVLTENEVDLLKYAFDGGMRSYHETEEFLEKIANSDKPGAKRSANALSLLRKTKPDDWTHPLIGKRQLYTVEIPEDNGSNYLDWENPLNDAQKEILKEGLMAVGVSVEYFKGLGFTLDSSFKYVYSASLPMMLRGVHVGEADNVKEKASRFLSGLGFTGIKYPAGTIHGGAEKGDMNYVIFNEKDAKITDHVRFFRTANGEAYGFTVGGKIYVDPRIATSETPVHEYAHLWATALRNGNAEEWQNVVGLMKDSKVWDEVKKRYPELKTDDEIADEVIATYSGQRGAERLREEQRKIAEGDGGVFEKAEAISALEKVKRALKMFWKGVADFLHIHYKSAEEVADRVMKDLLEGVDPRKMGDGVDRQRYASLGVSRSLGEEAAEGEPRWASSSLSEQQLDGDDTIRFSLNYDKWDREMASWLKRNRLPKNAQRPVVPQREAGESDLHFAGRLAKYNQDKALWNTAPKYEGHLSSGMTARGEFNYELQRGSVLKRIAIQDSMLAIRKAQEAIARHSGLLKVGTFEDAYMAENNSHGKAKNEFEQYDQEYLAPLRKWFNVMMKRLDGSYNNVTNYMIAKHGLERNAHMAFMAALEAEAKKAIDNTQPDAKRLRAQMVHDAYRQYKVDSRRLINDADYQSGKYDYAQWRRTDDAIRKSYCSNYESFRYNKGGVVRDYAGLSSLFLNETDFEEKAAEMCADIESKNGHETGELWDAVRQATRQILKNSHDAGMMSDETYDYVRGMYEHYIPLRGWNDSAADEVWDYAGGGRGVFNAALKEAHGRQSLADDPVAYIMNMAESGFLVNNKNWVKQHFLMMAMNHPSDLLTVSKAWYVKTKDQFGNEVWIPASPNIPADETDPAVIEAALDAFQTKMEQMEQSGDATQQRGSLNIEYPQTKMEEREHEVRVMKDGEEYVIYVNGDPQLAQALNNTRAMRVREHEGLFEKACAWLGRKMAAVYTSLSPLFVPSNWARDTTMTLASTAIREDARYNWLLRTKFMRPDVQMRMFGLVKEYQNGKLREKVKSRTATKTEKNFWNFMINGGETGFVSTMDVDAFREKIQRDLKDMDRTRLNPVKIGHMIADSVEYINRVIEDSNRFAIYQTSIEYGRGIEEAVQDAKNVTLNFNRKGTGEMGMSAIRQLYLFINPAIQSLQTLGALAKEHKAKFTAVTSAWMASGMLVPLFNELMFNIASAVAGGGGDDDDEFNPKDEYWKFSSFDRRNNCILWIPFTHNFIKIPLAQEFRGFYGIGDMVASAMWGGENAKESWSNYAADLMGQIIDLSPLDPVSYDGNVLVSLMPNAIRPLVEIAQNVTFTGKPIYRESDFNKYDPSFKKAYAGTPDFLLRYSKWMNSIGNKYPEAQQGPVEQTAVGRYANNPAVIDHLLKSYLGGMYTLGSQIAGAITKASDEETRKDFKTADIPFFSKFVANPNDRPQSKNKGDAYWQDFEKYQRSSHTLGVIRQDARKTGNFSVLEDFYKSEEYKEMKEYEPKAKQRKEEQKYERLKEEGNADLYQPHQQTGEDVYKRHSTPADDFEDTKASILYQKIKPAKDIFDLADINTPSGMDTFNKYYDLAGKVEEAHSVKKEMNAIVKSFVNDEHKAAFDPEKMKEYRALRKQYVQLVEEGNRMFEKIKAQRN